MAIPVFMPRLGLTMEQGTILAWPKAPGEWVEKGETVLIIETEKSEVEIPATESGWLRHLYVQVGETAAPGVLLAALVPSEDEAFEAQRFAVDHATATRAASGPAEEGRAVGGPGDLTHRGTRVVATPRARRLAAELGVDLGAVGGSGPGGRITDDDVRAAATRSPSEVEPRAPAAAGGERIDAGGGVLVEVLVAGAGADVLFLPGFGSDLSVFAPQVEALLETHRVLGLHPRGTGRSTAPERELYRVEDGAADALAVIERSCEGPVHVVGASLGAAVALELALRAPDRVFSLVLMTPFLTAPARLLLVLETWTELVRRGDAGLAARALLPWLFSEPFLADASACRLAARGLERMMRRTAAPALERWARGVAAWSGSRAGDLARLAPPTLLLHGGGDLLAPAPEPAWSSAPRSRTRVVPAVGHALTLEAPAQASEAIAEHLRACVVPRDRDASPR